MKQYATPAELAKIFNAFDAASTAALNYHAERTNYDDWSERHWAENGNNWSDDDLQFSCALIEAKNKTRGAMQRAYNRLALLLDLDRENIEDSNLLCDLRNCIGYDYWNLLERLRYNIRELVSRSL